MSYAGFLISNFTDGFDRTRQPWLLPDDAQDVLFDGYVYRGVWQKREGYTQFATGQRGGVPYCESRMVHRLSNVAMTGAIDGVNTVFTLNATAPIRRGTFTVNGSNPVQSFTDNGLGGFTGATGTINYTSGAVSITLPVAPIALSTVTATYDYHPGNPVMGIMTYFRADRERELIVADTQYVNKYNAASNRLDDISTTTYSGTNKNFWDWTNYNSPENNERLLFVNNKNPVQRYNGTTVQSYPIYTDSASIAGPVAIGSGDGTNGPYPLNIGAGLGIFPTAITITDITTPQVVNIDEFGVFSGAGTGTIDFLSGTISVTFTAPVPAIANNITIGAYTQLNTPIDTCLHIKQFKDHLIAFRPIISTKTFNKRVMISGTGLYGDIFVPSLAVGAGFIDIPTDGYIVSVDYNRDDIIINTNLETWIMKYTDNDIVPFSIGKIDGSRGSDAIFGVATYLNRTDFGSTRGFCVTDGYTVDRRDDKIPDYSYNSINQKNFDLCFAGTVDSDRDHYLIHPSSSAQISDRILVYNYEELNYAIYRIALSCMGTFVGPFTVTWNDLLIYNTWDEMAANYANWFSFAYAETAPISLGGGHKGQIFFLNKSESEDYDVKIRNISVIDQYTIEVTTDFQDYAVGDVITLEGISGMYRANDIQAEITSITTSNYTFRLLIPNTTAGFTGYVLNTGTAYKVIKFETRTKKFNPFADGDKKVKCGWMYMYVTSNTTTLTEKKNITGATQTNPCVLTIPGHGYSNGQQISVQEVGGMTQLNGKQFFVNVITDNTISLNNTDATGYTAYTTGGFAATPIPAKLQILVTRDDDRNTSKVALIDPEVNQGRLTNLTTEDGTKKWYKIWINQVGRFLQFTFTNQQAGANVQIQAVMPGFAGVGRMI